MEISVKICDGIFSFFNPGYKKINHSVSREVRKVQYLDLETLINDFSAVAIDIDKEKSKRKVVVNDLNGKHTLEYALSDTDNAFISEGIPEEYIFSGTVGDYKLLIQIKDDFEAEEELKRGDIGIRYSIECISSHEYPSKQFIKKINSIVSERCLEAVKK